MGMAAAPIYPGTLITPKVALTTANTTAAYSDFWTPSTAAGGKLESIMVTQDGTTLLLGLDWAISTGGTAYVIGATTGVTSGAGTDGTNAGQDALNATTFPGVRSDGVNRYFMLAAGWKLQVKLRSPLAAGKTLYVTGQAGDF